MTLKLNETKILVPTFRPLNTRAKTLYLLTNSFKAKDYLSNCHLKSRLSLNVSARTRNRELSRKQNSHEKYSVPQANTVYWLVIGRCNVDVFVLTFTRRTRPYLSGNASVTRPIDQTFLGVHSLNDYNCTTNSKILFWIYQYANKSNMYWNAKCPLST